MKYFLIAGEASGDLHASALLKGLLGEDPEADFLFIGGDRMADVAQKTPLQHYNGMNFMGFTAILRYFGRFRKLLQFTRHAIEKYDPDALILVDYAGFNLRMARFAAKRGTRVFYYISPKVWAWRKSRIRLLKRYVDRLFVIFSFEVDFFRQNGMEVEYHGNPLKDAIAQFQRIKISREEFLTSNNLPDKPVIALLAGSRVQEIGACLPEMIRASGCFPEHQFVVAGAPSVDPNLYQSLLAGTGITVVYDNTYNLLSQSVAAVVTSGTATLETALLNIPQVVVYKTGGFTYRIVKLFVNLRFFSLVNLIYGDELVREILQFGLEEGIRDELYRIINDNDHRFRIQRGYEKIRSLTGEEGTSRRIARRMVELLE